MKDFFENLADILANLPDNPLAIVSLIVLLVGFLAFRFFANEALPYKVFAFLVIFVGAAGIVYVSLVKGVIAPEAVAKAYPGTSGDIASGDNDTSNGSPETEKAAEKECPPDDFLDCGLED